jgi:hypothetical protein
VNAWRVKAVLFMNFVLVFVRLNNLYYRKMLYLSEILSIFVSKFDLLVIISLSSYKSLDHFYLLGNY